MEEQSCGFTDREQRSSLMLRRERSQLTQTSSHDQQEQQVQEQRKTSMGSMRKSSIGSQRKSSIGSSVDSGPSSMKSGMVGNLVESPSRILRNTRRSIIGTVSTVTSTISPYSIPSSPALQSTPQPDRAPLPIADFFPETTVMFADIRGFTAWCSTRERT